MSITTTRNNHYVPQWYQKGFLENEKDKLYYLNLKPDDITRPDGTKIILPDGSIKKHNPLKHWHTTQCFYQCDLYSTFWGTFINDEIERKLFGSLDNTGSKALWAFISDDKCAWHHHFQNFFTYIDSQKIRTPKGLDWIKTHYPSLNQNNLMKEMQGIRNMHCTIWSEGVREIVSAKYSNIKFILSDHPVTIYNYAFPPKHQKCEYPNDPMIALKGTQTIFPLDKDHCLILTNYEYAKNPNTENPTEKRTFAQYNRNTVVRTDTFIKERQLDKNDVQKINFIIKSRAKRYIGAANKEWLYPEKSITIDWKSLRHCLLPPEDELWHYGGEMYIGYEDGTKHYQDAFGRTKPENRFLIKPVLKKKPKPNDYCPCGYGKKFKKCCLGKKEDERASWSVLSIRERNIILINYIVNILGLNKGKTWIDVRKDLSDEQVKKFYQFYADLWSIDTDIISLLPKPDKHSRVVYTGIIDPRTVSEHLISLTPYFDDIIIQSPIINPNCTNPKFSSVENPHGYKQQFLKDVWLLFLLEPHIRMGSINLIPNPCDFDSHLRSQMFNMSQERSKNTKIHPKDNDLMMRLQRDDFERSISMMPSSYKRGKISEALPYLKDDKIDEVIKHIEAKKESDPLSILQEDFFKKGNGQLLMGNLSPNFEISLFLCQLTGAFLITDNHYRWNEVLESQHKINGITTYECKDVSNFLYTLKHTINTCPQMNIKYKLQGKCGNIRKLISEFFLTIKDENMLNAFFKDKYLSAFNKSENELCADTHNISKVKFKFLTPKGGIVHDNVQRMLLTCGSTMHLKNTPMAVLIEHQDIKA